MVCCELFQSEEFSLVSVLCIWTCSSPVIFERNYGFSFKALAHTDMDLLLPLFPQCAEHKFGSSVMHVLFVLENALNWPKWNFHQTSNLMDSNSSVFKYLFLHLIHIQICFSSQWVSWALTVFSWGHTAVELRKHSNPPLFAFQRSFQHSESKICFIHVVLLAVICAEFFWNRK